jgi:hypothetical protein
VWARTTGVDSRTLDVHLYPTVTTGGTGLALAV